MPTTLKMLTAMPIGTTSELILDEALLYLSSSILDKVDRVWPESPCGCMSNKPRFAAVRLVCFLRVLGSLFCLLDFSSKVCQRWPAIRGTSAHGMR